jgi:hypothetical protein
VKGFSFVGRNTCLCHGRSFLTFAMKCNFVQRLKVVFLNVVWLYVSLKATLFLVVTQQETHGSATSTNMSISTNYTPPLSTGGMHAFLNHLLFSIVCGVDMQDTKNTINRVYIKSLPVFERSYNDNA